MAEDIFKLLEAQMPTAKAMEGTYKDTKKDAIQGTPLAETIGEHRTPTLGEAIAAQSPTIGGIVGGLLGSYLGPQGSVLGKMGGSALGSALGGAAGTVPMQVLHPQPMPEFLKEAALEGLEQGALDLGGSAVAGILGKAGGAVKNKIFPMTVHPDASTAQNILNKYGTSLSKGQAQETGVSAVVEPMVRSSLFGSGPFKRLDAKIDAALNTASKDLVSSVGGKSTYLDRGQAFIQTLEKGKKGLDDWANFSYENLEREIKLYNRVGTQESLSFPLQASLSKKLGSHAGKYSGYENYMKSSPIELPVAIEVNDLKGWAKDQLAEAAKYQTLNSKQKSYLGDIASLPDKIPYEQAKKLRSRFLQESRDLGKSNDPNSAAVKTLGDSLTSLNDKIADALIKVDPVLGQKYKDINEFYRTSKDSFKGDNLFMTKMAIDHPEDVGAAIFSNGNKMQYFQQAKAAITRAAKLDKTVDAPARIKDLQAGYIESMLNKRMAKSAEGDFIGYKLIKDLEDPKVIETMKNVLDPDQIKSLTDLVKTSNLAQKNKKAVAPILMPILQATAIGGILGADWMSDNGVDLETIGKAGAVLVSPKLLAHILTKKKAVDALIKGQRQLSSGVFNTGAVVAKIVEAFESEGIKPEQPPQKEEKKPRTIFDELEGSEASFPQAAPTPGGYSRQSDLKQHTMDLQPEAPTPENKERIMQELRRASTPQQRAILYEELKKFQ